METQTQAFIRNLASLQDGTLSDLIVKLGDERWQIPKAMISAQSLWFRRALAGEWKESKSNEVSLDCSLALDDDNDPESACLTNGVDCMIAYCYTATYDDTKYNDPEPYINAQVVLVADYFAADSLLAMAKRKFLETVGNQSLEDWLQTATFIYDRTNACIRNHAFLRDGIIAAVTESSTVMAQRTESPTIFPTLIEGKGRYVELLADTLSGAVRRRTFRSHDDALFECKHCFFAHVGSRVCKCLSAGVEPGKWKCPRCKEIQDMYTRTVKKVSPCTSCDDGAHTVLEFQGDTDSEDGELGGFGGTW